MNKLLLPVLVFVFAINTPVFGWTIYRDFNSGKLGANTQGNKDAFDYDSRKTFYVDKDGHRAAIAKIYKNEVYWGGTIDFPTVIREGDVFTYEMDYYLPSSFIIDSGNGSLKWIRLFTVNKHGKNQGALDIQLKDRNRGLRVLYEGEQVWYNISNDPFPVDQWVNIKAEIGVHHIPLREGGGGYVKFWLNGKHLVTIDRIRTLKRPTDKYLRLLLHSYYNSHSPQDQHVYVDNIRISKR